MDISAQLNRFQPITLEQMSSIRLMNRVDTKYVVTLPKLCSILADAQGEYYVQEIDGDRLPGYSTAYLDTQDHQMYNMHERGRSVREKIRVRTYEASGLNFLEVKNKSNRGRTDKKRVAVPNRTEIASADAKRLLLKHAWFQLANLHYCLENHFSRITLVNRALTERLTIDLDLRFRNLDTGHSVNLPKIAIIEVKRDGRVPSPIMQILRKHRQVPCGFSKYCIGMAMTDQSLHCNRIKPRLRMIDKMCG